MNAKHILLGALVLAAPALAQEPAQGMESRTEDQARRGAMGKLPRTDVNLIKDLHQANQEEIQLGLVAQEKSSRDDVKRFGEMMVKDHREMDAKITRMANDHGITLGGESDVMNLADKFRDKKMEDFDRDYLTQMVKDHDKVIALVSRKSNDVKAELQAMIAEMLPKLRQHRIEARKILDEVKGGRASARTPAPDRPIVDRPAGDRTDVGRMDDERRDDQKRPDTTDHSMHDRPIDQPEH